MLKLLPIALLATLAITGTGITSAGATDTSQAIKLCEQNPGCAMQQEGDRIIMTVKGPARNTLSTCPMQNGQCTAQRGSGRHLPHVTMQAVSAAQD